LFGALLPSLENGWLGLAVEAISAAQDKLSIFFIPRRGCGWLVRPVSVDVFSGYGFLYRLVTWQLSEA
jgi:hypothetical protein